jgi:hypothetical protein
MKRLFSRCIGCGFLVAAAAGCSHETWTDFEERTRLPAMAAPILAPVNWGAKAGRLLTGRPSETSDSQRLKPFILSPRTMEEFGRDAEFMNLVLAVQDRFRGGDWGDISVEEFRANTKLKGGTGSIGRYAAGSGRPALVITDTGSAFRVRHEDEALE